MTDLHVNASVADRERRQLLFRGKIFFYTATDASAALCDYAMELARQTFDSAEPQLAHTRLPVEEFVKRAETTKKTFTNSMRSKELLRSLAAALGYDPAEYYFDVPRVRIVPHYDYLHAGVSYAYLAHRDTWYGGPTYQINHWMPAGTITPEQTMALYPAYFDKPVKNSSNDFDLAHWVNVERSRAAQNIQTEQRLHPVPLEEFDTSAEIRIGSNKGDLMVFSGTHLHATVPNRTATTRFSVDFRFFHVDDVASDKGGPRNVDSSAKTIDYGMKDCFRLSDFAPFRSDVR